MRRLQRAVYVAQAGVLPTKLLPEAELSLLHALNLVLEVTPFVALLHAIGFKLRALLAIQEGADRRRGRHHSVERCGRGEGGVGT